MLQQDEYNFFHSCEDCHIVAKKISEITRREIIVGDSKVFHHSRDGHFLMQGLLVTPVSRNTRKIVKQTWLDMLYLHKEAKSLPDNVYLKKVNTFNDQTRNNCMRSLFNSHDIDLCNFASFLRLVRYAGSMIDQLT